MAHHVAGLIAEADTTTEGARAVAEARAADLILRLWAMRRDLPEASDPLGPYRDAIKLLSRLHPEQNPWFAFSHQRGVEGLLADLFDSMAKVVIGGVLMLKAAECRAVAPVEEAALTAEERTLLQQLEWWKVAVKPEPFHIRDGLLRILIETEGDLPGQDASLDGQLQVGLASAPSTETEPVHTSSPEGAGTRSSGELEQAGDPASGSPEPSKQVTEALRSFQTTLARLVEAWSAKPGAG